MSGLRGLGEFDKVGNWGWQFYPPPYQFLAPPNSAPQRAPVLPSPAPVLYAPGRGFGSLSGCGCGCKGKGDCGTHAGMGLFESGLDWSQWGVGEWTAAGVGAYLTISLFGDLMRGGRAVKRATRRRRA